MTDTPPPPDGYDPLSAEDMEARIKSGDLLWNDGECEWQSPTGSEIGDYMYGYFAVARRAAGQ